MSRPSKFTKAIASEICERISCGESLISICKDDGMPDKATVIRWLLKSEEMGASEDLVEFRNQYTRAREAQAEALFDECLSIADEPVQIDKDGNVILTDAQRARLRVDTRKWMAGKLKPKKYGDKVQLSGDEDNPIAHSLKVEFMKGKDDE